MAKVKTAFFCRNCGAQSPKWMGKCPSCGEWNTLIEEVIHREDKKGPRMPDAGRRSPVQLSEVDIEKETRINLHDHELNRVLGGGLVQGSVVLIGGEPGIGKSTLMLQVALKCSDQQVLYISGEESTQQIRMRAERLKSKGENCLILTETNTQNIFQFLGTLTPGMIIVDSIQTLQTDLIESSAGSISQIRECAGELQKYSKTTSVPVFLIGHITKDGSLAGPKVLEHMVDTVLQFEGDRNYGYRILRSLKKGSALPPNWESTK